MVGISTGHEASRSVIVSRIVVLAAAAVAFIAGVVLAQRHDHVSGGTTARYVCPMHPSVVSSVAGDCPICHMALERAPDSKTAPALSGPRPTVAEVRSREVTQVVRAPAWLDPRGVVEAVVAKEALAGLLPGAKAVFFRGSEPATAIAIRMVAGPSHPWDAATARVRFASEQSSRGERDLGWVQVDTGAQKLLVVPASAVLYGNEGAYVLAGAPDDNDFARRFVNLGRVLDSGYAAALGTDHLGGVVVLSGLAEGERIVVAGTFLLDAELRLQSARGLAEEARP